MTNEYVAELLSSAWGNDHPNWPVPPIRRPKWWQLRKRRNLANIEYVVGPVSDTQLRRYWEQAQGGQSVYEDAGGYMVRCWAAMLGYSVYRPYTYSDAVRDIVAEGELP